MTNITNCVSSIAALQQVAEVLRDAEQALRTTGAEDGIPPSAHVMALRKTVDDLRDTNAKQVTIVEGLDIEIRQGHAALDALEVARDGRIADRVKALMEMCQREYDLVDVAKVSEVAAVLQAAAEVQAKADAAVARATDLQARFDQAVGHLRRLPVADDEVARFLRSEMVAS